MFSAHPFEAVGQQQGDSTQAPPLVLRGSDELIDDGFRNVPEIAELIFPGNQTIRTIKTVSVLETEHAGFGKRAVVDVDRRLIWSYVLKWIVGVSVFNVMQNRVPVAECSAFRVLTAEAHAFSLRSQRSKRQSLSSRPIER